MPPKKRKAGDKEDDVKSLIQKVCAGEDGSDLADRLATRASKRAKVNHNAQYKKAMPFILKRVEAAADEGKTELRIEWAALDLNPDVTGLDNLDDWPVFDKISSDLEYEGLDLDNSDFCALELSWTDGVAAKAE
jgi:hypothetical protein